MDLIKLQSKYENLEKNYDEVRATDFVDSLVETNEIKIIDFHYKLLKNIKNKDFFYEIRGDFYKHGEDGKLFLLDKLKSETDLDLKAEALFVLGGMDNLKPSEVEHIKLVANDFIISSNDNYKNQYYGIIVLGWIGGKEEIFVLEKILKNNKNSELRAYTASALRQIWYNHSRLSKRILKVYDEALKKEIVDDVNRTIIACIQDILRKKLGIKESQYGEISGNIAVAKPKAIKAAKKALS